MNTYPLCDLDLDKEIVRIVLHLSFSNIGYVVALTNSVRESQTHTQNHFAPVCNSEREKFKVGSINCLFWAKFRLK